MSKVYIVKLAGEDCRLENGFYVYTEAIFSKEEDANKVCNFMNKRLEEDASDTCFIGDEKYYVTEHGCVCERYYVEEEDVFDSADKYIDKLKTLVI